MDNSTFCCADSNGAIYLPLNAVAMRRDGTPTKCRLGPAIFMRGVANSNGRRAISMCRSSAVRRSIVHNKIGVRGHSDRAKRTGPRNSTALRNAIFTVAALGRGPMLMSKASCAGSRIILALATSGSNSTTATGSTLPFKRCHISRAATPSNCLGDKGVSMRFSVARRKGVIRLATGSGSVSGRIVHKSLRFIGVTSNDRGHLTGIPFGVASGAANRDRIVIASTGNCTDASSG